MDLLIEFLKTKDLEALTTDPSEMKQLNTLAAWFEYEELYLKTYHWLVARNICAFDELSLIFGHMLAPFEISNCLRDGESLFVTLVAQDGAIFRVHKEKLKRRSNFFHNFIDTFPSEHVIETICENKFVLQTFVHFINFKLVTFPEKGWEIRLNVLIDAIKLFDYYMLSIPLLKDVLRHIGDFLTVHTVARIYKALPFHLDLPEVRDFLEKIYSIPNYVEVITDPIYLLNCHRKVIAYTLNRQGISQGSFANYLLNKLSTKQQWADLYENRDQLFNIISSSGEIGDNYEGLLWSLNQKQELSFQLKSKARSYSEISFSKIMEHSDCSVLDLVQGDAPWVISTQLESETNNLVCEFLKGFEIHFNDLSPKALQEVLDFATKYKCRVLFESALIALFPETNAIVAEDCLGFMNRFESASVLIHYLTEVQIECKAGFDSWIRGESIPYLGGTYTFVDRRTLNEQMNVFFSKNPLSNVNLPENKSDLLLTFLNLRVLENTSVEACRVVDLNSLAVTFEYEELYLKTYHYLVTHEIRDFNELPPIFGHMLTPDEVRDCLENQRSLFVTLSAEDGSLCKVHAKKLSRISTFFKDLLTIYNKEGTIETICKDRYILKAFVGLINGEKLGFHRKMRWENRLNVLIDSIKLLDFYMIGNPPFEEVFGNILDLLTLTTVLGIFEKLPFHLEVPELWEFLLRILLVPEYLEVIYQSLRFLHCPTEIVLFSLAYHPRDLRERVFEHWVSQTTVEYAKPRFKLLMKRPFTEINIKSLQPFLASRQNRVPVLERIVDEIPPSGMIGQELENLNSVGDLGAFAVVLCETSFTQDNVFYLNFHCFDSDFHFHRVSHPYEYKEYFNTVPKCLWKDETLVAVDKWLQVTVIKGSSCDVYKDTFLGSNWTTSTTGFFAGDLVTCCLHKDTQENRIYRFNLETRMWEEVTPQHLQLRGQPVIIGDGLYFCNEGDWTLYLVKVESGDYELRLEEFIVDYDLKWTTECFGILKVDNNVLFFLQDCVRVSHGVEEGFRIIEEHPLELVVNDARDRPYGKWTQALYKDGQVFVIYTQESTQSIYRLNRGSWELELVKTCGDMHRGTHAQFLALEIGE